MIIIHQNHMILSGLASPPSWQVSQAVAKELWILLELSPFPLVLQTIGAIGKAATLF
jgi:hypothetical protein